MESTTLTSSPVRAAPNCRWEASVNFRSSRVKGSPKAAADRGGAINVVTKSGANTLHGDAFVFGQSGYFNSQPKIEETLGADPVLRRYRAGVAIGGPVSRNRTFYYAAA